MNTSVFNMLKLRLKDIELLCRNLYENIDTHRTPEEIGSNCQFKTIFVISGKQHFAGVTTI